jgi:hypothetical protein
MKIALTTLVLSALILVGWVENTSNPISSGPQLTRLSTSPNWVKLPGDKGQDFSVDSEYSEQKLITGNDGGVIKLNIKIKRPGHKFGDFEIKTNVKVEKYSFPDNEERLFTITLNPNNAYLNISPSPNTLYKHIKVDWEIKGINVSDINPDTFNFFYVGDSNEMLETSKEELTVDNNKHKIKVKNAVIDPTTTEDTPDGAWYGFTR